MSSAVKGARRSLLTLVWVLLIMFGALSAGALTNNTGWFPGLALDLAGGYQVILNAKPTDGSTIDQTDLKQAVEIIRKRVDSTGTSEAEISTQGDSNIIVALPGTPDESTIDLVRKSAQLQFRPVLYQELVVPTVPTEVTTSPSASVGATVSPSPSASEQVTSPSPSASADAAGTADDGMQELSRRVGQATTPSPSADPSADASPSATPSPSASASPSAEPVAEPADPSDLAWITDEVYAAFQALDCTDPANLAGVPVGDPNAAFVTCESDGSYKYILGPVELDGTDLSAASAGPEYNQAGGATGRFEVRLSFTSGGGTAFAKTTARLAELESPRNQFGILLDGVVISAPSVSKSITGGEAQITGNFTLDSAQQLANQLKFGALPLTLEVFSEEWITATKGQQELEHGLLAGLIGLILVVVYSAIQYRALSIVTVGSLVVAAVTSLLTISLLSWGIGYRLSLAGVAGLVVAIGITADSFIVYFERVRDELREGRSLVAAVEHGWKRARRTILASDAVSFLAALVLYILAVGGVRGFAFTLGLTTIVDLAVVILFTHPMLVLLARTKFFGDGHPWSGLDPRQLGLDALYKGKGRAAEQAAPVAAKLTLAERKAAARAGASEDKEQ